MPPKTTPAGDATGTVTRLKSPRRAPLKTTPSPRTRRWLWVEIADPLATDRVINELMGTDASARFRFIRDRAEEGDGPDV